MIGCLTILFLARSWWACISILIGFLYYYKEGFRDARFSKKIVPVLCCLSAVFLLALALLYKFGPIHDPAYRMDDRWGWWVTGLRIFLKHPWAGIGLGGYACAFPFFKTPQTQSTLYAHSVIVQLLSETGLIGLACSLFLATAFWQRTSPDKAAGKELTAYRAAFITILCFSLMTIYLEYFIGKLMLCVVTSLSLPSIKWKEYAITTRTLVFATGIILFLVPGWYLPFRASQWNAAGLQYEEKGNWELAESSYQRALALNPYEDGSCRGLVRLYRRHYEQFRSVLDLSASLMWAREAMPLKSTTLSYREKTN
jgi:tetratricopeptide (TPR) repeat protein